MTGHEPSDADPARRDLRAEIATYVSLVHFPATAEELIAVAETNGAPARVVGRLRRLQPGRAFDTAEQLWLGLHLEAADGF